MYGLLIKVAMPLHDPGCLARLVTTQLQSHHPSHSSRFVLKQRLSLQTPVCSMFGSGRNTHETTETHVFLWGSPPDTRR